MKGVEKLTPQPWLKLNCVSQLIEVGWLSTQSVQEKICMGDGSPGHNAQTVHGTVRGCMLTLTAQLSQLLKIRWTSVQGTQDSVCSC